tara:strand:- start:388 stop:582 length:195 start_codon:yes stop_codon:yes gene_type:complete
MMVVRGEDVSPYCLEIISDDRDQRRCSCDIEIIHLPSHHKGLVVNVHRSLSMIAGFDKVEVITG